MGQEKIGLRVLPVELLVDDPDVQLGFAFNEKAARKIAVMWSDAAVGVLAAAPLPDGTFGVIDGRHRRFAAALNGEPRSLRCDVFRPGLTPAEKARIKLSRDRDRRNVKQIERFCEEVIAEEPAACEIKAICEKYGYEVAKLSGGRPFTRFEAVRTLEDIYSRGPDKLGRVLAVNTLWYGEPKTNNNHWLGGLSRFVLKDYDLELTPAAYRRLKALVPGELVREARGLATVAAGAGPAGGLAVLIAERLRRTVRKR